MAEETLLNEQQSADFAGVTIQTIQQYKEFGLLKTVEKDGENFYKESALKTFFLISSEKKKETLNEQITVEIEEENTNISLSDADDSSALIQINKQLQKQLKELKEERDWLKKRIEVLETRSEREQMLSLSDSETIRRLINQQTKKKSFWTMSIPWFGSQEEEK